MSLCPEASPFPPMARGFTCRTAPRNPSAAIRLTALCSALASNSSASNQMAWLAAPYWHDNRRRRQCLCWRTWRGVDRRSRRQAGRHVPLVTSRVTSLAFGGADMRTLFITSTVGVGHFRIERKGAISAPAVRTKRLSGPALTMNQSIERFDPALDRIIAPSARVRNLVAADFLNDLGGGPMDKFGRSLEGGFWDDRENCLIFSDIANNRRMRWIEGQD